MAKKETKKRKGENLMPKGCPSCKEELKVISLKCMDTECQTQINGNFRFSPLERLSDEDQKMVYDFVLCSGSLKEFAEQYELSYPTIRNIIDELIDKLKKNVTD